MSQSKVPHIILNNYMIGGRKAKMRSEVVRIEVSAQVLYVTKGRKQTNKTMKGLNKTWYVTKYREKNKQNNEEIE